MKSTLDILTEARGYVAKGWTQGTLAKSNENRKVSFHSPRAVCWCALGALRLAGGYYEEGQDALERLLPYETELFTWNDAPGRTQAEVLALFDKAIEAERARNDKQATALSEGEE